MSFLSLADGRAVVRVGGCFFVRSFVCSDTEKETGAVNESRTAKPDFFIEVGYIQQLPERLKIVTLAEDY